MPDYCHSERLIYPGIAKGNVVKVQHSRGNNDGYKPDILVNAA
jgi:hypothetical protein